MEDLDDKISLEGSIEKDSAVKTDATTGIQAEPTNIKPLNTLATPHTGTEEGDDKLLGGGCREGTEPYQD